MPEEYLQVAFEIKAACDEISRRLLRWHWEQRSGSHTLDALIAHILQRRQESPEYYDRLPDVERKTSWQQLDTTFCMRVLLDPENDAEKPLDLLGYTAHPGTARRACNAVRTARNEAAHAADRASSIQAAMLFNEAVECLEDGYAGTALSEKELQKYYRMAEEYLARSGAQAKQTAQPEMEINVYPTGEARQKAAAARANAEKGAASAKAPRKKTNSSQTKSSSAKAAKTTAKKTAKTDATTGKSGNTAKKRAQSDSHGSWALWLVLGIVFLIGVLVRAWSMGLLGT